MCTFIVLYKAVPDFPIIAGMNRDEIVARKSSGPRLIEDGVRIYAPVDEQAGGTWFGTNECGMVAAILNRVSETPGDAPAEPRSRGLLCLDALKKPDALATKDFVLGEARRTHFNKFNLLCMDRERAYLICYDNPRSITAEGLAPGVHVLVNYDAGGSASSEETRRLKERSMVRLRKARAVFEQAPPRRVEEAVENLKMVFRDHESGVCQHRSRTDLAEIKGHEFATRSSTIIAVADGPALFLHSASSPCVSEYEDYSSMLHATRSA